MSFSFGTPAGQPVANNPGFSFGAPKTTPAPAFGVAPAAQQLGAGNTTFNFGAPGATGVAQQTSAPAPNSNFNFGPAAGTNTGTTLPTLNFGSSAANTAAPTFGLGGGAAAPTLGLGAGTAATPALGLGGTSAGLSGSTAAPTLGGTFTGAPTVGLGGAATTAPTLGLGGAPTAAPTFGLGGSATAAPTFGLGGPTTAAPTFGLGGTSTAQPTFGLGGTSTAQPTFGLGNTAAAAPTFSLGGTATAAPTFGLGSTSNAPTLGGGAVAGGGLFNKTTAPAAGLNFGTTTTSTGLSLGASGGLFGKSATSQAPAAPTTSFVGLGGIDVSATQPKAGTSKQDIKVKETQVPDEIAKTVDSLKTYIKAQKQLSSDIGRNSTSKMTKVSCEIARLKATLQNISNAVEANYAITQMMRRETSKANHTVDMAQRTQDTPAALQFENNAPFYYFQEQVTKYEQDLLNFKEQIALTENHMRSLTNPQTVTPDDLKRGFKQINESFISLAGRLHEIHQRVEVQKEQFLNLRKYRLHKNTNVFAELERPTAKTNTTHLTGRTPFTNISAISSLNKMYSNLSASGVNPGNVSAQTAK